MYFVLSSHTFHLILLPHSFLCHSLLKFIHLHSELYEWAFSLVICVWKCVLLFSHTYSLYRVCIQFSCDCIGCTCDVLATLKVMSKKHKWKNVEFECFSFVVTFEAIKSVFCLSSHIPEFCLWDFVLFLVGSCFIPSADLVEVCRFTFQTMNKSAENITDTYTFLQRRSPHETKEIKKKSRKCYRQSCEIQMVTIISYISFFYSFFSFQWCFFYSTAATTSSRHQTSLVFLSFFFTFDSYTLISTDCFVPLTLSHLIRLIAHVVLVVLFVAVSSFAHLKFHSALSPALRL